MTNLQNLKSLESYASRLIRIETDITAKKESIKNAKYKMKKALLENQLEWLEEDQASTKRLLDSSIKSYQA